MESGVHSHDVYQMNSQWLEIHTHTQPHYAHIKFTLYSDCVVWLRIHLYILECYSTYFRSQKTSEEQ